MGAAFGAETTEGYVRGETEKEGDFREEATLGAESCRMDRHPSLTQGRKCSRQRHGPTIKEGPFEDTPGVLGLAEVHGVPEQPAGQEPGQGSSQASPCLSCQEVGTLPRSDERGVQ